MWRLYIPPPILHSWREPSERAYTSSIHFLREKHLLMCWDQDIPFQPQESWSLAFPKLLSTQISFHHSQICERELSVGETIIWSTRARSSSSGHYLLPFGEWCLLDWLGVNWEPLTRLWSWTKEFVRARRSPTSWRSTLVRQVLRGQRPWWDTWPSQQNPRPCAKLENGPYLTKSLIFFSLYAFGNQIHVF